jgi:hypothetical protein
MPASRLAAAAIVFASSIGVAFAQGPSSGPQTPADPVKSRALDEDYRGRCEAKVSKELCACVVATANVHINDLEERKVFFDYMMGDVEKAKAERALFTPQRNMTFNIALQKAESMLGQQCDKLQPKGK